MSAFDRLPEDYRKLCGEIAKASAPLILAHRKVPLSPQNRRVRYAADLHLAAPMSPNGGSRQLRRAASKPWKRRTA